MDRITNIGKKVSKKITDISKSISSHPIYDYTHKALNILDNPLISGFLSLVFPEFDKYHAGLELLRIPKIISNASEDKSNVGEYIGVATGVLPSVIKSVSEEVIDLKKSYKSEEINKAKKWFDINRKVLSEIPLNWTNPRYKLIYYRSYKSGYELPRQIAERIKDV